MNDKYVVIIFACIAVQLGAMHFERTEKAQEQMDQLIKRKDPTELKKWLTTVPKVKHQGAINFALDRALRYAQPKMVNEAIMLGAQADKTLVVSNVTPYNQQLTLNNDVPLLVLLNGINFLPRGAKPSETTINDMVEMLLMAQANVNSVSERSKMTPLMYAAWHGYSNIIQTLLKWGAKIDAIEPTSGNTALFYAIEKKHTPAVQILLDHGASPAVIDRRGQSAFTIALPTPRNNQQEMYQVIQMLLSSLAKQGNKVVHYVLNFTDNEGLAPLLWAVKFNYADVIDMLLNAGAEINQPVHKKQRISNDTAKQLAARHGLGYQAEPQGATPLLIATKNGHLNVLELLLNKGADPAVRDADGRTIFDYIRTYNQLDAMKYLEKYAATLQEQVIPNVPVPTDVTEDIILEYLWPDLSVHEKTAQTDEETQTSDNDQDEFAGKQTDEEFTIAKEKQAQTKRKQP